MRTIIFSLLLLFSGLFASAQSGSITNIQVSQRTDGSGLVDVFFDLTGEANGFNILLEVSFDGGESYTPVPENSLEGGPVPPDKGNHITWNGQGSFPNTYSTEAMLKIIATEAIGVGIPCPGMPTFTDSRDGNVYSTVLIGEQCWLKENLRYLPRVYPSSEGSGEDFTPHKSVSILESASKLYYYVYDYEGTDVTVAAETDNYRNYGVLYNWFAALEACPTGWHLPSHNEWTELEQTVCQALGNSDCDIEFPYEIDYSWGWNGTNEGNALKSCRQVNSPLGGQCATSVHPRWESNWRGQYGIDKFGFSALPGGLRAWEHFQNIGYEGIWWSSTEYSKSYIITRAIFHSSAEVLFQDIGSGCGLSVRCVRDK